MKAIIFIALLVIAAQAGYDQQSQTETHTPAWAVPLKHIYETLNPTQNQNGFADELNLNETLRAAGKTCVDAINKGFKTMVTLAQKGQHNQVLLAIESVGIQETIKSEIIEACQPYAESMKLYFEENRVAFNFTDAEEAQKFNLVRQGFAQQYGWEILDSIINKKAYDFGRIQGKLFKLAGNMDSASRANQYTQFNSTKPRPVNATFNMTEFSTGFWTGYLKATGNTEKFDINDFVKCGDSQMNIKAKIEEIQRNAGNNFLGRLTAQAKIAEEIAALTSECWVEVKLMLPLWNKIKEDPIRTIARLYHGAGLSTGQVAWLMTMFIEDVQKTDYLLGGEAMGTIYKLQTKEI